MSLSPNPDVPIEEEDPTELIEPTTSDAPLASDDIEMIEPGPADPRPATEPGEEFDSMIAPHFL